MVKEGNSRVGGQILSPYLLLKLFLAPRNLSAMGWKILADCFFKSFICGVI
jgi:hypothetical protein